MDLDPTSSSPLANWPRPLCFVFSGGGSYGAIQVGMIRALVEADIVPDMVVGSSVGALNGTLLAADPRSAAENLHDIWSSMSDSGVFGGRTRFSTAMAAIRNGLRRNSLGLYSPGPLRSLIDTHVPVERLEDLVIPTAVVVTDALVGQPKLLTQGSVGPILQASSAIPGVFPPVKIEGCFYVDGGVSANVPVRQAVAFGARSLVVLDANPATMPGTLPRSILGSVMHASMIMLRNQRADAVDDLVGRHPILHLPQVTPTTQSSFDFDHSAELIEAGYTNTAEFLGRLPVLTDSSRRHPPPERPPSPSPAPPASVTPPPPPQAPPQSKVKL